jgi:proteasome activator subunit 4
MAQLRGTVSADDPNSYYVHKLNTGFLVWEKAVKAYRPVGPGSSPFTWETSSQPALQAIKDVVSGGSFWSQLALLFGQESSKNPTTLKLRTENVTFVKSLGMWLVSEYSIALTSTNNSAKMYEHEILDEILGVIDPLLTDNDRYQQRAGAELLAGLLRGSKHWPQQHFDRLWDWLMSRLEQVYHQIKPDTLNFWEGVVNVSTWLWAMIHALILSLGAIIGSRLSPG